MFDWMKNLLTGNKPVDFLETESNGEVSKIVTGEKAIVESALGGADKKVGIAKVIGGHVTKEDNSDQLQSVRSELHRVNRPDMETDRLVEPENVGKEILEMVKKDQEIRTKLSEGSIDLKDYQKNAKELEDANNKRLDKIFDQLGWPVISTYGEEVSNGAWLLIQHADSNVPLQERALELMKAAPKGEVKLEGVAYLEDRVRINKKEPQLYGTQNEFDDGGNRIPSHIENPEELDARRASMGLLPYAEQQRMYEEFLKNFNPQPQKTETFG